MPTFWALFWLGFIGFPLLILSASIIKHTGSEISTTHKWVYKKSGGYYGPASVRDVWEHFNPRKSWDKHKSNQFIGCSTILIIAFLFFLTWLLREFFQITNGYLIPHLFGYIFASILGGLSAGVFLFIYVATKNNLSISFKLIHTLILLLMIIVVIGFLVLTFVGRDLPISHHWIWATFGFSILIFIFIPSFHTQDKKKANKASKKIEDWIFEVLTLNLDTDKGKKSINKGIFFNGNNQNLTKELIITILNFSIKNIQTGKYDKFLHSKKFFKQTEHLILDFVRGRPILINSQAVLDAQKDIIKALQVFYLYITQKFPEFKIHPKIKSALKK